MTESAGVVYDCVVATTVPEHAVPAYQAKLSGLVPPDGLAVIRIDCPRSIAGEAGVIETERLVLPTVTVSVAFVVTGW